MVRDIVRKTVTVFPNKILATRFVKRDLIGFQLEAVCDIILEVEGLVA